MKPSPIKFIARRLRRDSTDVEKKLWQRLRNRQLEGYKFRRQWPIGPYVPDFVCFEVRLIIELDGGQHTAENDAARTAILEKEGWRVLRFWNNEVSENIEGVLETVLRAVRSTPFSLV